MRRLVHALALIAAPLIVAWYGLSVPTAFALIVLLLLWRWGITLSMLMAPPQAPELELETIPISHFAEKVRWCMDRLGVDYSEKQSAGILGALFRGRTVPQLKMKTGIVRSVIGNSAEILRYLWGRYGCELGDKAAFLEPTPERVEMEKRIDRYGAHLQVWIYYHMREQRDLMMTAWGIHSPRVPAWQRALMPVIHPVMAAFIRRVFRISDEHYAKVVGKIEALLEDVESLLDDGRRSILGGENTDYVDIAFASISALWMQPEQFAAGRAKEVQIDRDSYPLQMGIDVERWSDRYPLAVALVQRLYREERVSG